MERMTSEQFDELVERLGKLTENDKIQLMVFLLTEFAHTYDHSSSDAGCGGVDHELCFIHGLLAESPIPWE